MTAAKPSPSWQQMISQSLCTAPDLAGQIHVSEQEVRRVIHEYPMRINPYALDLIRAGSRAVRRQLVPDSAELEETTLDDADPLHEQLQSPVPNLVHRYPDRVLFLVSSQCAVYCRHCMRKREVGGGKPVSHKTIDAGMDYIGRTPEIREVILSGGDPLMLEDSRLFAILERIRCIDHVELIRIHTRMPGMLPQRITRELAGGLARFHPLYVNIQFNHPDELTAWARRACGILADAGIALGAQTVLLGGVNDDPRVMICLMRKLLAARVRPYYLHHPDPIRATDHFRVPLETGLAVIEALRGHIGGMGVPQYMIDLPGGGGKVPLLPDYVIERSERQITVYNYEKKPYVYPL
jgi:lysine 2,3-aminomutase